MSAPRGLSSSGSSGSSLGGVRQKFTPEYLAKQLPVFQERVPRVAQESLKFPTDAPPNLPLPPLLPGEEIQLQQHRVACLEAFAEPTVGSLYITNFRLIFNGNSISDPESRDSILEGLPARKEHAFSLDSGRLPRLRNTRHHGPATFNSYLTNPEQAPPTTSSKWKLSSLRRGTRSGSDNNIPSVKKSSSLRRSPKSNTTGTTAGANEATDGGTTGGVWGDIGSVLNRGARSLRMPGKRKGVVVTHHEGIPQWDSVSSISSVSGTDETSEREMETAISPVPPEESPVFTIGSVETAITPDVLVNGSGPKSLGCPVRKTALPEIPLTSVDSGVDTDPFSESWAATPGGLSEREGRNGGVAGCIVNVNGEDIDFEKYSPASLDPILETEAQKRELMESSVDPSRLLDPSLEQERQAFTRRSWFHRSASPTPATVLGEDSGSDEEGSEDDERLRTLTQAPSPQERDATDVGYSKVEILAPKSKPPQRSSSPVYSLPVKVTGRSLTPRAQETVQTVDSEQQQQQVSCTPVSGDDKQASPSLSKKPLPPAPPVKLLGLSSSIVGNTGKVEEVGKEKAVNSVDEGEERGSGGRCDRVGENGDNVECKPGYANFSVMKLGERERSVSNPWPLKKPVPLPRNDKAGTLDRLDSSKGFGCSLPADFKPTPAPRKPTIPSSPKTSRSPQSQRPPISAKPLLPKSSPPLARPHRPPPSPPSQHSTGTVPVPSPPLPRAHHPPPSPPTQRTNDTAPAVGTPDTPADKKEPNISKSPVPPPRRKRKANTTPTHRQPLSPIHSPHVSPVKTVAVPSDTGSSDPPDTSSESDHSHPHNKFLPSPSPVPRSPSPFRESSSPLRTEWHNEQNSSTVAQRNSIPSSIQSSIPPSPLDSTSTYGYVGDREPLPAAPQYSTLNHLTTRRSLSPLPTSTRYSYSCSLSLFSIHSIKKQPSLVLKEEGVRLPEGITVLARNFRTMKLHIHPHNRYDADGLKELLEKKILVEMPPQELFAFHYCAAIRHPNPNFLHTTSLPNFFKLQDEFERLKLPDYPVWHISSVLKNNPEVSPSYPREVIVPRCIPDLDLLRGAKLYRQGRFPTLTWCSLNHSVFLLRAGPTHYRRGQSGSNDMCLDEAVLQAVCVFTEKARGSTKLYIFTEKPDSSTTALSDPMHTSLTEAQKRAYYYHNCQFQYSVSPPTYKNIRHSFRKLAALLEENKVGEDEFLIVLDDTRWLYRIQELLQTASAVVSKMEEESASVLISYDCGWDRTAQISGLAQLLLDPYYRTMDGFQILVQKEWLWFGHPFQSRHTRHARVKEDGPVFLQWVDCVWQVMQQCPSAFEFNEKFLMVLIESSYSGQFGSFLLNSELERHKTLSDEAHKHKSVTTHTLSFWTWVTMVNAAGRTFYNHLYDPNTFPWVIHPNCTVPCLKLWTSHHSQSRYQDHHWATNTTPLYKQLEQLVREYQRLSSKADVPVTTSITTSISPSPSTLPEERPRVVPKLERERERVHQAGRSTRSKTPVLYQTIEQYLSSQGIDSTVCKHAEIAGSTCQGYLTKLGGVRKNWQERWFVLDFASQLLTYFESREAFTAADRSTPKGVVELNEMSKVWQNTKKTEHMVRHVFTVETKNRTYLFRAPSLITMQLWMAVLQMPRSVLQVDT